MAAGNISDSCVTAAGGEGSEENSPKEGRVYFMYFFFLIPQGAVESLTCREIFVCVIAWKKPTLTPCLPSACCHFVPTEEGAMGALCAHAKVFPRAFGVAVLG